MLKCGPKIYFMSGWNFGVWHQEINYESSRRWETNHGISHGHVGHVHFSSCKEGQKFVPANKVNFLDPIL